MERKPAIYIATNRKGGVLYAGVTSNLEKRMAQHKAGTYKGFAKKYNCNQLVYFQMTQEMDVAIAREKQIKGHVRRKKIALIEGANPEWQDLSVILSEQSESKDLMSRHEILHHCVVQDD